MKLAELAKILNAKIVNLPDPDAEAESGYCGDFLSFVMQRAPEKSAWFTVMTNVNVAAVASLTEVAVGVVCEGSKCDAALIDRVRTQNIALFETDSDIVGAVKAYVNGR